MVARNDIPKTEALSSESFETVGSFWKAEPKNGWMRHLKLIPYDFLVLVFIAYSMIPPLAAALLVIINFGTWWCYHRIPYFLRYVSGHYGKDIVIPDPIVEHFALFIKSCGVHHRAHYGLMFAMMAGFHFKHTGHVIWNFSISAETMQLVAWVSYFGLVVIDGSMLFVSARAVRELKRDKIRSANQLTDALSEENKKLETFANIANRDLEDFARIAAHDLRSPLRSIGLLATWIEEDLEDTGSDDTKRHLGLMKDRVKRLDKFISGLLEYTTIGQQNHENIKFSLKQKAQDLFSELNLEGLHTLQMQGDNIWVLENEIIFDLIFGNLMANAIKHNDKPSTKIFIAFYERPSGLKISVEDNGPGVDPEYRQKIFDVFSTLERRDVVDTTGLGLAIVKKVVDQHQGRIETSKSDLGGLAVHIHLPIKSISQPDTENSQP